MATRASVWFMLGCLSLLSTAAYAAQTQVAVGGLSGGFSVSAMGDATYSIPLSLPPSVNGAIPQISLGYNSQAGVGLAGLGWNLNVGSGISRCPQTVPVDGANLPLNFSATDRFCLDGQRLILTSGVYGANGATYQTELNNFDRVTSYTHVVNPNIIYFKVETKDGMIKEYGATNDSVLLPNVAGKLNFPINWMINKSYNRYRKGQLTNYTYSSDSTNGQQLLTSINYAYDINDSNPAATVSFTYTTLSNYQPVTYVAGNYSIHNKQLSTISISAPSQLGAAAQEINRYILAYDVAAIANVPKLKTVTSCAVTGGANLTCLAPVTLSMPDSALSVDQNIQSGLTSIIDPAYSWVGDFNGDGVPELTTFLNGALTSWSFDPISKKYIASNAILTTTFNKDRVWVGDCNGDGRSDLLTFDPNIGLFYCYSTVVNLQTGKADLASFKGVSVGGDASSYLQLSNPSWIGDYNGDGFSDILIYDKGSSIHALRMEYTPKNGQIFGTNVYTLTDLDTYFDAARSWIADFNNDGKKDILTFKSGVLSLFSYDNTLKNGVFQRYSQNVVSTGWSPDAVWVGDFNGDSVPDLLTFDATSNAMKLWNLKENGVYALTTAYTLPTGVVPSKANAWVGDLNGDGLSDFMIYQKTPSPYVTMLVSNGSGAFISSGQAVGTDLGVNTTTPWVADFNGDGKTDLLGQTTNNSVTSFVTTGNNQPKDGLLKRIDEYSANYTINYALMRDVYYYDTLKTTVLDATHVYVVLPSFVVSSVSTLDGVGGLAYTDYIYGGLTSNIGGRGVECFQDVLVTDRQSKIKTDTMYYQSFPYTGMLLERLVMCDSSACNMNPTYNGPRGGSILYKNLLSDQLNIYNVNVTTGSATNSATGQAQKIHFPYLKNSSLKTYDPPVLP